MSSAARAFVAATVLGAVWACERAPTRRPPPASVASETPRVRQPRDTSAPAADTILLAPAAFPVLPREVRRALEARGCLIPAPGYRRTPRNVIVGSFARPGQIDWAVLCWKDQRSTIVVFWGGPSDCPAELANEHDSIPGPVVREGWWNDRFITAADASHGQGIGDWPAPPFPPQEQIDHWGIEDASDKASDVWYCYAGRWSELPGAD